MHINFTQFGGVLRWCDVAMCCGTKRLYEYYSDSKITKIFITENYLCSWFVDAHFTLVAHQFIFTYVYQTVCGEKLKIYTDEHNVVDTDIFQTLTQTKFIQYK